jgi:hypothetical protein
MDALTTSLLVAVAAFVSSLVGLSLHRVVPDGHLSQETRSVILLGMRIPTISGSHSGLKSATCSD